MERKLVTCPETAHLEEIEYETSPCGMLIASCTRFRPRGDVECARECAARMDRRSRPDADTDAERSAFPDLDAACDSEPDADFEAAALAAADADAEAEIDMEIALFSPDIPPLR